MFVDTQKAQTVTIDKDTWRLWLTQGSLTERNTWCTWTETAMRDAVERVNRGALLLDEKKPKWVAAVIPTDLDMASAEMCIIGQAYGSYDMVGVPFGIPNYGDEGYDDGISEEMATEHGFCTGEMNYDNDPDFVPYSLLDRVWVYMLHERHQRKTAVVLTPPDLN